ncbi:MAG: sensor histidine kinase, partial [Planctomycetota bacterium]
MRILILTAILSILLLLVPFYFASVSAIEKTRAAFIDEAASASRSVIEDRRRTLNETVSRATTIMEKTSSADWLVDYLAALQSGEPNAETLASAAREAFSKVYKDSGGSRRVTILDSSGREVMGLRTEITSVVFLPSADLQDYASAPWFQKLLEAKEPERAGFRATPIYRKERADELIRDPYVSFCQGHWSDKGTFLGAVVSETDLRNFFESVASKTAESKSYLLNSERYYLIHPDIPSKGFSFEKSEPSRVSDDFPLSADKMVGRFSLPSPPEKPDWLFVGDALPLTATPGSPSVLLITARSIGKVLEPLGASRERLSRTLFIVIPLFLVALVLLFKFLLLDPLNDVRLALAALRAQRHTGEVPLARTSISAPLVDEIRALAASGPAAAASSFPTAPAADSERVGLDLAAVLGRELRSPLTSIKASIDLVRETLKGQAPEHVIHFLEVCYRSSDHIIRLLDGLLDMAKIQSGASRLNITRFNVADVARAAAADVTSLAAQNNVDLKCDFPEFITLGADRQKVEQILFNLLCNGVKFARGSWVRLTVRPHAPGVRIEVTDGGPGTAVADSKRIF